MSRLFPNNILQQNQITSCQNDGKSKSNDIISKACTYTLDNKRRRQRRRREDRHVLMLVLDRLSFDVDGTTQQLQIEGRVRRRPRPLIYADSSYLSIHLSSVFSSIDHRISSFASLHFVFLKGRKKRGDSLFRKERFERKSFDRHENDAGGRIK